MARSLILGGIRSGKSALAETLLAGEPAVTYVATARRYPGDDAWADRIAAHRRRRPASWATVECGDPHALAGLVSDARTPLLVDDLGNWVAGLLDGADTGAAVDALASAVAACRAPCVLVAPEVGLSVVPATAAGRAFADVLGTANQAVAGVCDRVALVVAGQPLWVKGTDPRGVQ